MRVDEFDFELPERLIALRPAEPRENARLLHVTANGTLADRHVRDLPELLRPDDLLVFNDTKVIPARLRGRRVRTDADAGIEAMLHLREASDRWRAFLRPAKKVREGDELRFGALHASVIERGEAGEAVLRFDRGGPALDAAIAEVGELPLPPYIEGKRATDEKDATDYQTVFASRSGAVAAPTAGLHWTDPLLERVAARGVADVRVTLHVGAGTFLPVKANDTADHVMHAEWGEIDAPAADAIATAKTEGRRVVAVGTTSLRLLEASAQSSGDVQEWAGTTDIFITPGFQFQVADVLMTNFHLPRSTLMMLVSAFTGLETMKRAYAHAIDQGYRFYSYGDACLLERTP